MLNKRNIREFISITVGTIITACAVFFFMMPSHVTVGSAAGLAIELGADEQKADDEQAHIHHHRDGRYAQWQKFAQHDGKTGGAAHGHMAGHHKEENRTGGDDRSHGDADEFPDIAFVKHGASLFPIDYCTLL